jgi:hypothetical protein
MKTCTTLCCAALAAASQTLSTGRGDLTVNDSNEAVVLAPPPLRAGTALEMATLPIAVNPPQFCLNYGTSGRYGPYPLANDTPVGNRQAPYTLRLFDVGRHFTLQAPHDTNTVYGPFPATNGAAVTLGRETMTLLRFPPQLAVSLNHPGKINQRPLIGVAPYTPALERELHVLRAKYVALANRMDEDTADIRLQSVPRIHSRSSGNVLSPVIGISQRDKQNAARSAELSAVRFLETLFGQAFRIRSQSITDGNTYQFGMPPGDYIFCALQKIRDPRATGVSGSLTAVWWTPFAFDGEHPRALALTAENAITWRELFTLTRE